MRVWSELGPEGAGRAAARGDVVVLVDALRSGVTIAAALAAGARRVVPAETPEEARAWLGRAEVVVAGERGGVQVPDFDFGNSPTQLMAHGDRLAGQTLILATSNGTPLVRVAAAGARAVLVGSLPDADAAARAAFRLASRAGCDVALLAAGVGGLPAAEDDYAVAVLAARLAALGAETDIHLGDAPAEQPGRVFRDSPNGRRLARLGYAPDVALCARLNVFARAGVLIDGAFTTDESA